jgi:hypothetical protein
VVDRPRDAAAGKAGRPTPATINWQTRPLASTSRGTCVDASPTDSASSTARGCSGSRPGNRSTTAQTWTATTSSTSNVSSGCFPSTPSSSTSDISAQFGPGPLRPTGLNLQIASVGAMSVVQTPPRRPGAGQARERTKTGCEERDVEGCGLGPGEAQKVQRPRSGLIADLRRAVSSPLESAVRRPAWIPAARRLYRRVTR